MIEILLIILICIVQPRIVDLAANVLCAVIIGFIFLARWLLLIIRLLAGPVITILSLIVMYQGVANNRDDLTAITMILAVINYAAWYVGYTPYSNLIYKIKQSRLQVVGKPANHTTQHSKTS